MSALDPERVRVWLERMHPTDDCGLAGEFGQCPLACFLNEAHATEGSLVGGSGYTIGPDGLPHILPAWAVNFVDRVDTYGERNGPNYGPSDDVPIAAQVALDLLDKATRYPHYEDAGMDEED